LPVRKIWLERPSGILTGIFDLLTLESSFIDGRLRESWEENSNLGKLSITRTESRVTIETTILGYSILGKRTKLTTSKRLGQRPDGEGL